MLATFVNKCVYWILKNLLFFIDSFLKSFHHSFFVQQEQPPSKLAKTESVAEQSAAPSEDKKEAEPEEAMEVDCVKEDKMEGKLFPE